MKPVTYISLSVGIFVGWLLGFWILIFLLPDVRPYTGWDWVLWAIALVLVLPTLPLNLLAASLLPPDADMLAILSSNLLSTLIWPYIVGLLARSWKRRCAKSCAPSTGGTAQRLNDPAVGPEPPSVS